MEDRIERSLGARGSSPELDRRTELGAPWTGMCISGGGPRSLAAAMGELRGLAALGLLTSIGGLATAADGTWEGRFMEWAPPRWPDAALLGPVQLDPGWLRWTAGRGGNNLSLLDSMAVISAATLFGDGDEIEDQSPLPLLRRNLRKIIAFVNTGTPLSMTGPEVVVDARLPPLFGLEWSAAVGGYVPIPASSPRRFNQVFQRATFDDLRRQLWNRAQVGATAMAVQKNVTVLPNPHYGVAGGTTDLLWIYLHPVNAWYRSLHDTVRLAMELEPLDYAVFPNYDTTDQLHLNPRQVNLLAHLTSWNVASGTRVGGFPANAEVVRGFVGG